MMYSTTQAAKVVGVDCHTISNWNTHGLFRSFIAHPGTGSTRIFDKDDLCILAIVKRMKDSGAEGKLVRRIAEYLLLHRSYLTSPYLILEDNSLFKKVDEISDDVLSATINSWVIDMGSIVKHVDLKCAEFSS